MNFVGIDFGTTNSVVSYLEESDDGIKKINVLEIKGRKITPTAIFFNGDKVVIGEDAVKRGNAYPESGVRLFKRAIGSNAKFVVTKCTSETKKAKEFPRRYFVIDTNVFINNIEIMEKLKVNEFVILPEIVVDKEIPFRGNDGNTDIQAKEAMKLIDEFLEEKKMYRMESDEKYIPLELKEEVKTRNDENDNKIFSIAHKLKKKNYDVVLLTGDRRLREKAENYHISTMKPGKFLDERNEYKREKNLILTAEDCASIFLKELKRNIDKKLKGNISNAVITTPANFNEIQRGIVKSAAKRAGFENIRIEDEPVAAVINYGEETDNDEIIAVYDFGGGTFDFSIIKTMKEEKKIEVMATDGEVNIGGENFTEKLVKNIIEEVEDILGIENLEELELSEKRVEENRRMMKEKGEEIKKLLSSSISETCSLEGFYIKENEQKDIRVEVEREDFNEYVVDDIIDETEKCMSRALDEANLKKEDIDKIVLAGGTTYIPRIKERVERYFGKNSIATKDLATVVSQGAIILGKGKFIESNRGGIAVIESLNRSIGVKVDNEKFYSMLNCGEKIPCERAQVFAPKNDYQKSIEIEIFSKDKYSTGVKIGDLGINYMTNVTIENTELLKSSETTIELTFEVDENKVLNVFGKIEDEKGNFSKEIEVKFEMKK